MPPDDRTYLVLPFTEGVPREEIRRQFKSRGMTEPPTHLFYTMPENITGSDLVLRTLQVIENYFLILGIHLLNQGLLGQWISNRSQSGNEVLLLPREVAERWIKELAKVPLPLKDGGIYALILLTGGMFELT